MDYAADAPATLKSGSTADAVAYLKEKFPGVVTDDTRPGFHGVIVEPSKLVESRLGEPLTT